jgi:hypothetical protein
MAGAVSDPPDSGGLDPALGVNLRYFTGEDGFSRPMCRLGIKRGLIWADAFVALEDGEGRERLVCHYAHMESLAKMLGHGLAIYDDERQEFERIAALELKERWRWPGQAHPIRHSEGGVDYLLLGEVFPTARVPADLEQFTDLDSYEAWSCLAPGSTPDAPRVDRDATGQLRWSWRRDAPPVDARLEARLIASGQIKPDEARYNPVDVDSGKRVLMARGSVSWNPYRRRWILIAGQQGGTSNLGEIWYAEAPEPTGPWLRARKIVTHDRYSFYNPVHHPFFDQEGGRLIYFEGTYVNTFSGNPVATPRYDYNQIMYRLDLSDPRLRKVHAASTGSSAGKQRAGAGGKAGSGLEWIRLGKDGKSFVRGESGERFLAWGVNYDHDSSGRLLEEYWSEEWPTVVEDLREIKALGANTVRIHLQVARFMEGPDRPRAAALERLRELVRVAGEIGLYLDLTGLGCYHEHPEWYRALRESERWDVQARFWETIARACRESPAVFCYDLMNEPILPGEKKPETEWLTGELGGKYFVQRIALDLRGRTREEVARAWVNRLVGAIRKHDDRHLITVGVIPWALVFPGARPLFYSPRVGEKLDFASVHFYPRKGEVAEALEALAVYDTGNPLVIEEMFPLKCGIDELESFIDRSRKCADGWLSFYWGTTIEEYAGKEEPTLADAITGKWLERFREKSRSMVHAREPGRRTGYLDRIGSHFRRLLAAGRDEQGPVRSGLWMSVLSTGTGAPPETPHTPGRVYRQVGAPRGSTLYWDQPLLVAAHNLTRATSDPRYAGAARAYVAAFLEHCVSPEGVYQWGNHMYYDAYRDAVVKFSGGHHELRPISPAWELFWRERGEQCLDYIRKMSRRHVYDEETGGFNRHDDGKRGHAFLEAGGVLVEALAWAYSRTREPALLERALRIPSYSYGHRNPKTGLIPNDPDGGRWDAGVSTTEVGLWALCLLRAAEYTKNRTFLDMAASGVRAYLEHGYDQNTKRYFGQLALGDGRPVTPERSGYWPRKYSTIWNPDQWPTHDYPLSLAEACLELARATNEGVSREGVFRQGARRWAEVLLDSPAPSGNQGVYAETYGRSIHFLSRAARVLGEPRLETHARRLAAEAVDRLFHGGVNAVKGVAGTSGMFQTQPGTGLYRSVDGLGYLFLALIELETGEVAEGFGFHF